MVFRCAVDRGPDNVPALINFGAMLAKQQKFAEAAEICRRAIALAPDDPNAHVNLAAALEGLGHLEEAEKSCRWRVGVAARRSCRAAHAGRDLGGAGKS